MGSFLNYQCSICNKEYASHMLFYTCPADGGNLNVVLDYPAINAATTPAEISRNPEYSIWRYLPLLPIEDPGHIGTPLRSVGWTPLYRSDRLGKGLGLQNLWIKDDGRNPTASFKDRASAVVVARAQAIGAEVVITASTGNAGAAQAGMSAAAQSKAVILAPKNAPPAKVAQLLIFGAKVILVDGSYDDAFDLTVEAAEVLGWYCRNTGYNPFTAEGKKTAAFEMCEQLTLKRDLSGAHDGWVTPDTVFTSVGDGNIISGLHKGFKDMYALGWTDKIPKIFGVQSTGSAAIFHAYQAGTEQIEAVEANTLADSISVDLPRDGLRALRAATHTGGAFLAVSDEEILRAISDLAKVEGVFAEPAGATSYAGLVKAKEMGLLNVDEHHLVLVTGSGLKDVSAAMDAVREPMIIEPSLEALREVLGEG